MCVCMYVCEFALIFMSPLNIFRVISCFRLDSLKGKLMIIKRSNITNKILKYLLNL